MANNSSIWGSILGSVGSTFSATGDVEEQARNRKAASELKWRGNTLSSWATPTGEALFAGLQPGGDIRKSWYDEAAGNINTQYAKDKSEIGANAWKYGGAGSPLTGRKWYETAKKAEASGFAAQNQIDAKADALLADLLVKRRTTNWTADPVEVNAESGYSTVGSIFSNVGSGLKNSGSSYSTEI